MHRKRSDIRKREIVEASLEIIKEYGIQKLSLKRIANRIGISEQAIYRHFDSKLEILRAIIEYFNTELKKTIHADLPAENVTAQIHALTSAHMTFINTHPAVASVIFSEEMFQNEPELAEIVRQALMKRLSQITQLIQQGQQTGEFDARLNPSVIARMLLGSLRLNVVIWRLNGYQPNLLQEGQEVVTTILNLIKTEEVPVPSSGKIIKHT